MSQLDQNTKWRWARCLPCHLAQDCVAGSSDKAMKSQGRGHSALFLSMTSAIAQVAPVLGGEMQNMLFRIYDRISAIEIPYRRTV